MRWVNVNSVLRVFPDHFDLTSTQKLDVVSDVFLVNGVKRFFIGKGIEALS